MKKVLIIANLDHASPRIPALVTHFPEFGWEATIITPAIGSDAKSRLGFPQGFLEKTRIIEAPYRGDIFWFWRGLFKFFGYKTSESITEQIKSRVGVSKQRSFVDVIMKWYQTFFAYPDTERTWKKPALRVARKVLEEGRFDAILSSSPFPTSHIVASKLKKKFELCWIADFRDPWTENHIYPYPLFRKVFERALEVKTMRKANALVAASPLSAEKIAALHKRNVHVVTNGFNPDNISSVPACLTDKFTITYTGTIYTGKQNPGKFLTALRNLIEKKLVDPGDIAVGFYGRNDNWLRNEITVYGLSDIIKQYGTISRSEALERQRESQLLLYLNWDEGKDLRSPLKFYEYLAAQRPILASGGFSGDDIESMLFETKAGVYAPTVEEIESALLKAYEEYKHSGRVSYGGDLKEINKYSYRKRSGKVVDILDQIKCETSMRGGFDSQYSLEQEFYLKKMDFLNWFRYFYIVKDVVNFMPTSILEIGAGDGIVKACLQPMVKGYTVLDVNSKLKPDITADLRDYQASIENNFDCVIAADVLEHMPFADFEQCLKNLYSYLKNGGKALLTIPHRRSNFLFMTPTQIPHVVTVPTGFLSIGAFYRRFIKRKIWIDPHHCWELGDGKIRISDVEQVFGKVGFTKEKFKKLLYVDYWVLSKQ